jgi:coenzyme Q-binding protein COQ10
VIVQNSIDIKGSLKEVYALAKDIYSYPEFMPDIKSIKVIERSEDGRRIVSEWAGIVREFRAVVQWTAEDIWDDETYTCKSSLVKSNYYTYEGQCKFIDLGDCTRVESEIEVDCDIPRIRKHVKGFVAKKMKQNLDNMLASIKARVEA